MRGRVPREFGVDRLVDMIMDEQMLGYDRVMGRSLPKPAVRLPVYAGYVQSIIYGWFPEPVGDAYSTSGARGYHAAVGNHDVHHGGSASSDHVVLGAFRGRSVDVTRVKFEFVAQSLSRQFASFGVIARDRFACCRFSVRRPQVVSCSPSIDVGPPPQVFAVHLKIFRWVQREDPRA